MNPEFIRYPFPPEVALVCFLLYFFLFWGLYHIGLFPRCLSENMNPEVEIFSKQGRKR